MSNFSTAWMSLPVTCSLVAAATLAQGQTIRADHTTVDVSVISSGDIQLAQALRMSLSHASVGGNIWSGLSTLAGEDQTYAFPNWTDNDRGNPGWAAKVTEFETWVTEQADNYDVFQNKFCYIDQDADFVTYRDSLLALEEAYPERVIVWWTIPLETSGDSNELRASFNEQVRAYCASNDKPLYDIADIESHTEAGEAVTESDVEALDPAQSSDGGHLNELGSARAAAAQWALMAQIAGWDASDVLATGGTTDDTSTDGDSADDTGSSSSEGSGCSVAHGSAGPASVMLGWAGLLLAFGRRRLGGRSAR